MSGRGGRDYGRGGARDGETRGGPRDGGDSKGGRDSRDRAGYRGDRGGYGSRRQDARSRSPARGDRNVRERTPPPRGPRSDRPSSPGKSRGNISRNGPSQPSSRDPGSIKKEANTNGKINGSTELDTTKMEEDDDEDEEAQMKRMMGFGDFRSTKNTKIPGNSKNYGVAKAKKTEYRQYMNRKGGFNRPLSPGKE